MSILAFLNMLFLKVIGFILSILLVWTVPPQLGKTTFEPEDEAGLKLQASVVSDVHMQSFEYTGFQELSKTLRDIAASKVKQDALVFVGDNTMNGQSFEYLMFYGILSHYNKVSARNTLVTMGNHEFFAPASDQAAIDRHNFFLQSYNGTKNDTAYYSQKIKGYTFIILGEDDTDEQAAWLDDTMAAAEAGKPVFVFAHEPFYDTAALEGFPDVFLFNGHWHTPLDVWDDGGITRVNLPGLHSHEGGEYAGEGVQLEVYADKVVFRGRNYMKGEWLGEDDVYEIMLTP